MKHRLLRVVLCRFAGLLTVACLATGLQAAQQRDHLTEGEADLVREMQIIDQRIDIFIQAADRRLLVLSNPGAVQKKKEEERWGPLPSGTRLDLLVDFKKIFAEAMEKIDDAAARNKSDPLLGKALDKFKKAASRQITELRALTSKLTDKREERALLEAIEEAEVAAKGSLQ